MQTLSPSGDTTGVTDTAAINAALVSEDVTLSSSGAWYVKADAAGQAIKMPQNRTLQGPSASDKASIYLAGTSSATFDGILISNSTSGTAKNLTVKNLILDGGRNGFQSTLISFTAATKTISISSGYIHNRGFGVGDTITIAGSASNNGNFTIASITATTVVVNEALVNESAGATVRIWKSTANGITNSGACIGFAGQNDYGSNNILLQDLDITSGATQSTQINSCDGVTYTRVTTTSSYYPAQASHGNDFDAVAVDKPSKNITFTNCTLDSYGQECVKFENTTDVTATGCTFNAYVTVTQDALDMYSQVDNINFVNCTFNVWVSLGYLKRKHTAGQAGGYTTPAATLTLGQAGPGTSIACTASASVFSAADLGKSFSQLESSIQGFATITGYTSPTSVTITIISKFADTSVASGWKLGYYDNDGLGRVSFSGCRFLGDDALIYGNTNSSADYGSVTITGCTFTGRNSYIFPSAFSPTVSGNVGVNSTYTAWVRNTVNDKYKNVYGTAISISFYKTMGSNAAATPISNLGSALFDSYNLSNIRITWVDDTYTQAFLSGHTNGNTNLAFSIEGESYLNTIIDGTGSTGAFIGYSGTNTQIVTVKNFLIKNFTGGSSTRGISINHANANFIIKDCKIQDCLCTNGGGGIRLQSYAGVGTIQNVWFLRCSSSGTSHAGGLLVDVGGVVVKSCRFDTCSNTGTGTGGGARISYSTTAVTTFYGCEFVGCSTAASGGGLAFSNSTSTPNISIINCTFAGNTATTSAPDATLNIAGTATGTVKNTIMYSTGTPLVKTGGGTLTVSYSDIRGGFAGTGNISSDPLFMDAAGGVYTLSPSSPARYTGTYDASAVDRRGNYFNNPPTMGAWEFLNSTGGRGGTRRRIR